MVVVVVVVIGQWRLSFVQCSVFSLDGGRTGRGAGASPSRGGEGSATLRIRIRIRICQWVDTDGRTETRDRDTTRHDTADRAVRIVAHSFTRSLAHGQDGRRRRGGGKRTVSPLHCVLRGGGNARGSSIGVGARAPGCGRRRDGRGETELRRLVWCLVSGRRVDRGCPWTRTWTCALRTDRRLCLCLRFPDACTCTTHLLFALLVASRRRWSIRIANWIQRTAA
jgi:hypothetical protein